MKDRPIAGREKSRKTCGDVLASLAGYRGKGFLTEAGARKLEASKRKRVVAKSPWDES